MSMESYQFIYTDEVQRLRKIYTPYLKEKETEVGVFLPDDVPDGVKEAFKKAQEIMRQREKEYIESLFE